MSEKSKDSEIPAEKELADKKIELSDDLSVSNNPAQFVINYFRKNFKYAFNDSDYTQEKSYICIKCNILINLLKNLSQEITQNKFSKPEAATRTYALLTLPKLQSQINTDPNDTYGKLLNETSHLLRDQYKFDDEAAIQKFQTEYLIEIQGKYSRSPQLTFFSSHVITIDDLPSTVYYPSQPLLSEEFIRGVENFKEPPPEMRKDEDELSDDESDDESADDAILYKDLLPLSEGAKRQPAFFQKLTTQQSALLNLFKTRCPQYTEEQIQDGLFNEWLTQIERLERQQALPESTQKGSASNIDADFKAANLLNFGEPTPEQSDLLKILKKHHPERSEEEMQDTLNYAWLRRVRVSQSQALSKSTQDDKQSHSDTPSGTPKPSSSNSASSNSSSSGLTGVFPTLETSTPSSGLTGVFSLLELPTPFPPSEPPRLRIGETKETSTPSIGGTSDPRIFSKKRKTTGSSENSPPEGKNKQVKKEKEETQLSPTHH